MAKNPSAELIEWLFGLRGPSLKWDIDTARGFSAWLGHPERRVRSAHVAGTNGKGSVAAMLHSMALCAGLRCGLSTSPHLVRPEERIRLGKDDIAEERFVALIAKLRDEAAEALAAERIPRHPSFFEMVTLAAMLAFAEDDLDFAVYETGLGGRLDATNIVHPHVSIITTIGRDHIKSLGGTLESIAAEKGGIIKPGIPVLLGDIDGAARKVLADMAAHRGAPLYSLRELKVEEHEDGSFDVYTPQASYTGLRSNLAGAHQVRNAALAIRAAELLRTRGIGIDPESVRSGLAAVRWPARLERLKEDPRILFDAAHNTQGIATVASHLRERDARLGRPQRRVLLFGLTNGRDAVDMTTELKDLVDEIVATRPHTPRAIEPAEYASELESAGFEVIICDEIERAFVEVRGRLGEKDELLVAGSLYLVGEARRLLLGHPEGGQPRAERVPDLEASNSERPVA